MDAANDPNGRVKLTVEIPRYVYQRLERLAARQSARPEDAASWELNRATERGWYVATPVEWAAGGDWIHRNLFPPPDYCFQAKCFEREETLYTTPVDDPLLKGIVDGVGHAAPWKYRQLLDALKRATGAAGAHAFYVALHDNMVAETRWVARYDWAGWWHPLYGLELEPGAEQGGASYVGILSEGKDWLLMHDYNPCNDLTISFHGTPGLCAALTAALAGDGSADGSAGRASG